MSCTEEVECAFKSLSISYRWYWSSS